MRPIIAERNDVTERDALPVPEKMTFEFKGDPSPYHGKAVVNGHVVPCYSVDVRIEPGSVPMVTLAFPAADLLSLSLDGGGLLVKLTEETRAAMISLGWTPPADGA